MLGLGKRTLEEGGSGDGEPLPYRPERIGRPAPPPRPLPVTGGPNIGSNVLASVFKALPQEEVEYLRMNPISRFQVTALDHGLPRRAVVSQHTVKFAKKHEIETASDETMLDQLDIVFSAFNSETKSTMNSIFENVLLANYCPKKVRISNQLSTEWDGRDIDQNLLLGIFEAMSGLTIGNYDPEIDSIEEYVLEGLEMLNSGIVNRLFSGSHNIKRLKLKDVDFGAYDAALSVIKSALAEESGSEEAQAIMLALYNADICPLADDVDEQIKEKADSHPEILRAMRAEHAMRPSSTQEQSIGTEPAVFLETNRNIATTCKVFGNLSMVELVLENVNVLEADSNETDDELRRQGRANRTQYFSKLLEAMPNLETLVLSNVRLSIENLVAIAKNAFPRMKNLKTLELSVPVDDAGRGRDLKPVFQSITDHLVNLRTFRMRAHGLRNAVRIFKKEDTDMFMGFVTRLHTFDMDGMKIDPAILDSIRRCVLAGDEIPLRELCIWQASTLEKNEAMVNDCAVHRSTMRPQDFNGLEPTWARKYLRPTGDLGEEMTEDHHELSTSANIVYTMLYLIMHTQYLRVLKFPEMAFAWELKIWDFLKDGKPFDIREAHIGADTLANMRMNMDIEGLFFPVDWEYGVDEYKLERFVSSEGNHPRQLGFQYNAVLLAVPPRLVHQDVCVDVSRTRLADHMDVVNEVMNIMLGRVETGADVGISFNRGRQDINNEYPPLKLKPISPLNTLQFTIESTANGFVGNIPKEMFEIVDTTKLAGYDTSVVHLVMRAMAFQRVQNTEEMLHELKPFKMNYREEYTLPMTILQALPKVRTITMFGIVDRTNLHAVDLRSKKPITVVRSFDMGVDM